MRQSARLLALLYATFISLGLPDSLLGTAWPVMQTEWMVPFSLAGVAAMVICSGTIVSTLCSGALMKRFGTASLTGASVALTAAALFGTAFAPSFGWLLAMALPLGLGAGAVDAALNHFVATHYQAHHMNWLHCFWGVGAMAGPVIMARAVSAGPGWRAGYLAVSLIQWFLVVLLLVSRPAWRRIEAAQAGHPTDDAAGDAGGEREGNRSAGREASAGQDRGKRRSRGWSVVALPGVRTALLAFLLYSGLESTMGLWGASFLVREKGFTAADAAFGASLFYGSLTVGRLVSGFVALKKSDAWLIRTSLVLVLIGAGVLLLTMSDAAAMAGFALVGLGCAAIYPAMLHQTPERFAPDMVPNVMGMQMAVAYAGSLLLPPAFGWVTGGEHMWLLPVVLLLYGALMLCCTEGLNRSPRVGPVVWP